MGDDRTGAGGRRGHDVDFLPVEYRQTDDRRRRSVRRILLATGGLAVIAALAWSQHHRARRLAAELRRLEPARAAAVEAEDALGKLQSQLRLAQADASLITYLRHPWPRTQIIAAILSPLPNEITFEQLSIRREASAGLRQRSSERRSPARAKDERQEPAGLAPAARDLETLRAEFDSGRTMVTITGVTTESSALYRYLGALSQDALFSKSQVQSIEADPKNPSTIRFQAALVVRPGYGQPGGPSGQNLQPARPSDPATS
jgi:hypothetical protein